MRPTKNEEEYWSRKTRVNWVREGDRNTHYFHAVTAERRKRNRIESIKAGDGTECYTKKEIAGEITRYFECLFTTDHPRDCENKLEGILKAITEAMNRNLTQMVKNQGIKKALFSM